MFGLFAPSRDKEWPAWIYDVFCNVGSLVPVRLPEYVPSQVWAFEFRSAGSCDFADLFRPCFLEMWLANGTPHLSAQSACCLMNKHVVSAK